MMKRESKGSLFCIFLSYEYLHILPPHGNPKEYLKDNSHSYVADLISLCQKRYNLNGYS